MNPNYILWAIPFFLLTLIGELIHDYFKKGRKDFNFEDNVTNLNLGFGFRLLDHYWILINFYARRMGPIMTQ